ncbi:hypothetical protein X907_2762 [Glycocaulis alkaliphilus]|uniref:Uncharacterized protein n=1 Tax=Glycocaulis alkaliphilus TaxID=1434191 RepID=A0A3T0EDA6_9PROT|nr:hypothetical protein [Glycocaulis alkaliphilus]AZU05271.1 hypothetical protein X907_2762 [Glycocaulis alkaliphilus]GGB81949.1 hypothetical protein GCM10007417_22390 [Glycocaulis alkaliphilus]
MFGIKLLLIMQSAFHFYSVDAGTVSFVYRDSLHQQGEVELVRLRARDLHFAMTDCSSEELFCLQDQTGYEIAFPKSPQVPDLIFGRYESWNTGRYTYNVLHEAVTMFRESAMVYTIRRSGGGRPDTLFQMSTACGLIYAEFTGHELTDEVPPDSPDVLRFHTPDCGYLANWVNAAEPG